jgi:hypothetical protein
LRENDRFAGHGKVLPERGLDNRTPPRHPLQLIVACLTASFPLKVPENNFSKTIVQCLGLCHP